MKEQSHKEEMSAAIRGDFQRLRERGVSVALAPHDEGESAEPEPAESPTPIPPGRDAPERRGWLSRLAGRQGDPSG